MAAATDLVDRATVLPPGPELSAVLAELAWAKVPNARLVEVLRARSRQLAHDQAELFAGMVEISHAVAVADLLGAHDEAVARAAEHMEWASHEIAAGLTWTPTATDRELTFASTLVERLPLVFAALQLGHIDRGKARVFAEYIDPATGELTEQQSRRLCERFLPQAPRLTTKQLSDRLYRALHAIDPELRRRRYERAVQERSVALYLDPRTGTATLAGNGLPPDEAAAAAERIDRMVEAAKRAGHPGRRPQISADLYLGMLNGCFHGLTEAEIIGRLLATPRPEDDADDPAHDSADDTRRSPTTTRRAGDRSGQAIPPAPPDNDHSDRWARDRVATREGIEIRLGLATLARLDDRPGEIPGLGPIGAEVARHAIAAQRRGACWKFAIVDTRGHLLLAGPLRRRPRPRYDNRTGSGRVRGGVVELHLTVEELQQYATDPVMSEWHGLLAELAARWADRDRLHGRLAANPHARFARGPLADHTRIRDRNCCGPGCTRPARHSDLDHTRDHGLGGPTVDTNIGPACKRHHPDKQRGWSLTQPGPGLFRWVSPLGRIYHTTGEPIRPDLPDPDPQLHSDEDTDIEFNRRLDLDLRILHRPAEQSPRPPPPLPPPPPDDRPPPF